MRAPTEFVKPPVGHSSKYFIHLIRNPRETGNRAHHISDGIIYNDWMQANGEKTKHFKIDAGVVTILHPGHYYVYAQVGIFLT